MKRAASWLFALSCLSGCALLGKSEPLTPSYYTAEPTTERRSPAASPDASIALRLGRVLSGSHLRERVAFRRSPREVGYYEERRWTERPELYVRRALSRALFEQRSVEHVVSGVAPTLDVELLEFEELLAPRHAVRVSIRGSLSDARSVALERTFSVELPVPQSDSFDAVAEAMASALARCVDELADAVATRLGELSRAPVAAPEVAP